MTEPNSFNERWPSAASSTEIVCTENFPIDSATTKREEEPMTAALWMVEGILQEKIDRHAIAKLINDI